MTDIERIIQRIQRRLDDLSDPEIWHRYTKDMECGELREFKQSCIDDEIILSALRAQKEQESNDPLTLDELRQMDGEPVWWWNTSAKPVCAICVFHRFLSEPLFANYDFMSEDTVKLTKYKWLKKCGYKPYRRKPEEGTK